MSINSFFVAGQYVGNGLPALQNNKFSEFCSQEKIVHPGAYVFAYVTPSSESYQEIFGEEIFSKPNNTRGLYIGTAVIGDLELITGREPTAHLTIVKPQKKLSELLTSLNSVTQIQVGLIHNAHPELDMYTMNKHIDERYKKKAKSKEIILTEQLAQSIKEENYERAATLRDEIRLEQG